MRLLFVCLGNICRSSAAEEIFRCEAASRGVAERFEVDSAGTYGGHAGQLPDERMRRAGSARGYSFTHRSRPVVRDDFGRFDLILAMDDAVYETLNRLAPDLEAVDKVERMADYLPQSFGCNYVPDPYYEGADGFELVLDMLEASCGVLLTKLSQSHHAPDDNL